jgi:transcriptional regulator with XRE-family HTH domain
MKLRKVTRDELAAVSGYSAGVISSIRKGHDFSTEQLLVICQLLNASPDYIMNKPEKCPQIELINSLLSTKKNPALNQLIIDLIKLKQ